MITSGHVNASEAARQIGCSVATVSRWADRLGCVRRYGNSLALTKREVELIRKNWRKQSGNPDFAKKIRQTAGE